MKIADPQPPYCAACFQAPGDTPCVDFEAAYDGPVIPGTPEPIPVDDLVVCFTCLNSAFAIADPQGLRETISELTQMLEDTEQDVEAKDRAIQGFRSTTTELIEHPVAKFPGKPKLEGVPEEIREQITKRRLKRGPTAPSSYTKKKKKEGVAA